MTKLHVLDTVKKEYGHIVAFVGTDTVTKAVFVGADKRFTVRSLRDLQFAEPDTVENEINWTLAVEQHKKEK